MAKTKALEEFQKLTRREIEAEVPKNSSEVRLRTVGLKVIRSIVSQQKARNSSPKPEHE